MTGRLDLTIPKGATFQRVITWQTKDPVTGDLVPVDLTGYKARSQFRESYTSETPLFNLTTENMGIELVPLEGKIIINISAESSSQVSSLYGVWDLEVYQGDYVTRLLEGRVKLTPEVTR